ncbi:lipoprotein [Clostridium senegalense]|uniref:LptM family lipoprotein n=1 Tax=Clostridium senegalense TaxID=1465809 RepID=UPI00028819F2|nr:hypothetical protein [Clostridium senegalense]
MKKVLSIVLAAVLTFSLTACGANTTNKNDTKENTTNTETTNKKDENKKDEEKTEEKAEEVKYEEFGQLLNAVSEKDYYYDDIGTIKILNDVKKEVNAAKKEEYIKKTKEIIDKEMTDKKVDLSKIKVYDYYKNANGEKSQKSYVVVYGDDKVPTTVYEVMFDISETDEPSLKETKENKELINDDFKTLFKADLEKPAEKEE